MDIINCGSCIVYILIVLMLFISIYFLYKSKVLRQKPKSRIILMTLLFAIGIYFVYVSIQSVISNDMKYNNIIFSEKIITL